MAKALVLAMFQPSCPIFPGATRGHVETVWGQYQVSHWLPSQGVLESQKILELKTEALDKLSVLSK